MTSIIFQKAPSGFGCDGIHTRHRGLCVWRSGCVPKRRRTSVVGAEGAQRQASGASARTRGVGASVGNVGAGAGCLCRRRFPVAVSVRCKACRQQLAFKRRRFKPAAVLLVGGTDAGPTGPPPRYDGRRANRRSNGAQRPRPSADRKAPRAVLQPFRIGRVPKSKPRWVITVILHQTSRSFGNGIEDRAPRVSGQIPCRTIRMNVAIWARHLRPFRYSYARSEARNGTSIRLGSRSRVLPARSKQLIIRPAIKKARLLGAPFVIL